MPNYVQTCIIMLQNNPESWVFLFSFLQMGKLKIKEAK